MPITPFQELAYTSSDDLIFGRAVHPVTAGRGVVIGNGAVLPEVNFTLPAMTISEDTLPEVRAQFCEMVTAILQRAVELHQEALVIEFEQLFELTHRPEWGSQITSDLAAILDAFYEEHGLRSALRVTVADIRDLERPPQMRQGEPLERMLQAFELNAEAGADILSIESTGGKEISDQAMLAGDLGGLAYALGVLASRDMAYLWEQIGAVARRHGIVAGGDTACGIGNTAMQLAHQRLLPRVLAAVIRLMTAPRSLVAVEAGATGPLKDCGYENPILKAISGVPISMEGKTSACAHSSPLGNIAGAMADLWSNESVNNVRLLSGYAPQVFAEILIYDTRLMNAATEAGQARTVRDLLVASDRTLDPQAMILAPDIVWQAAERIITEGPDPYQRTLAMARLGVEVLNKAVTDGTLTLSSQDARWLNRISAQIEALPEQGEALRDHVDTQYGAFYRPEAYPEG